MLFNRFDDSNATRRRPVSSRVRRAVRSCRPEAEVMEGRQLLTTFMVINNVHTVEGTGSNHQMNFTVQLTSPSAVPVTVNYGTSNRSATAGSDFVAKSGTLTFAPGETAKNIPVTIIGDSQVELSESFSMLLSSPTNAIVANGQGIGTILDDDTAVASTVSINDVAMTRGLDGSKSMLFTVSLNAASSTSVSVTASTSNVTAIAGDDYQAASQVLTFAPGETTKQFAVTIYGTPTPTSDKVFFVTLSNSSVGITRATGGGIEKFGA